MLLRSWATINITNLIENLKNIHSFSKKGIFAVVKADAYGHDAELVSKYISELDFVKKLCVATPLEGKQLRDIGIEKDIVVLGGILEEEKELFLKYRLTPVISTYEGLFTAKLSGIKKIHLKFDTGMNRLGFFEEDIDRIKSILNSFEVEGIMSHFPSADIDEDFTNHQIKRFRQIIDMLNIKPNHVHIQNSAATTLKCDFCTDIRIGLAMYGEKPVRDFPIQLKNVMSVFSKIVSVKNVKKGAKISYCGTFEAKENMRVAVVSFGYADGLPRIISNKGYVLIDGKRAKIVGNITMDMTMVDISYIDATVGQHVVIVGKSGKERISFSDIASLAQTIPYEVMCGISKRVKRVLER